MCAPSQFRKENEWCAVDARVMAESCYMLSVFRVQRHPRERAARSFTRHGDTVSSHAIRIDCLLCEVEGRRHQHKSLAILVRGMGEGLSWLAETR